MLLKHLRTMYRALQESYPEQRLTRWMGHRPSMPDSLPVIGPSSRSPDVIYAFGHGHIGMASGPMTGLPKLIASIRTNPKPSG